MEEIGRGWQCVPLGPIGTQQLIVKRLKVMRHDGGKRGNQHRNRKRPTALKEAAAKFDPEKYSEASPNKEECEEALLVEYGAAMATFVVGVAALTAAANSQNLLPKKIKLFDLLLLGVGTHKLSRIMARDRITGALRAPFVQYKGSAGSGEVEEEPRGRGFQQAIGELVSCPYCMGPWCAAALGFGMVFARRTTRFFASILATVAISDFLNRAYAAAKES